MSKLAEAEKLPLRECFLQQTDSARRMGEQGAASQAVAPMRLGCERASVHVTATSTRTHRSGSNRASPIPMNHRESAGPGLPGRVCPHCERRDTLQHVSFGRHPPSRDKGTHEKIVSPRDHCAGRNSAARASKSSCDSPKHKSHFGICTRSSSLAMRA